MMRRAFAAAGLVLLCACQAPPASSPATSAPAPTVRPPTGTPAPAPTPPAPTPPPPPPAASTAPAGWTIGYARRDLTPGVRNPAVTQATIGSTICVRGWTATVRPPVSYTNALKASGLVAYGYDDTNLADYKEDHVIPLEGGGNPTDPSNLFPQPVAAASMKDQDENAMRTAICTGTKTLAQAQADIIGKWVR